MDHSCVPCVRNGCHCDGNSDCANHEDEAQCCKFYAVMGLYQYSLHWFDVHVHNEAVTTDPKCDS